mmetsp:Transcript_101146/g.282256  ORF Transcript_101146/g.282256 Transcript_101146/m.282256 type:complete len:442 (+) Transcript_101146:589-1914(+)
MEKPTQSASASAATIALSMSDTSTDLSSGPARRWSCSTSQVHAQPAAGPSKSRRTSFMSASWPRLSCRRGLAPPSSSIVATRVERWCAAQCRAEQPSGAPRPSTSAPCPSRSLHIARSPALAAVTSGGSPVLGSRADGFACCRSRYQPHISRSPSATTSWNSAGVCGSSRSAARWILAWTCSSTRCTPPGSWSSTARSAAAAPSRVSAISASEASCQSSKFCSSLCNTCSIAASPRTRSFMSAPHSAAARRAKRSGSTTGVCRSQGREPRIRASVWKPSQYLSADPDMPFRGSASDPMRASASVSMPSARRRRRLTSSWPASSTFRARTSHFRLAQSLHTGSSPRADRRARARRRSPCSASSVSRSSFSALSRTATSARSSSIVMVHVLAWSSRSLPNMRLPHPSVHSAWRSRQQLCKCLSMSLPGSCSPHLFGQNRSLSK